MVLLASAHLGCQGSEGGDVPPRARSAGARSAYWTCIYDLCRRDDIATRSDICRATVVYFASMVTA